MRREEGEEGRERTGRERRGEERVTDTVDRGMGNILFKQ